MTRHPWILVYNPISNHGHLDSWNAMFVAALLEHGWRVQVLTPDVPALTLRLEQKGIGPSPRLQILDWNAIHGEILERIRARLWRWWRVWDVFGDVYFYKRKGSELTDDMGFWVQLRTRMFQILVPPAFRLSHYLLARVRRLKDGPAPPLGQEDPEANYLNPADFGRRVAAGLRYAHARPALILNMYMDMYKSDAGSWRRFAEQVSIPWAGIRFVPLQAPSEGYYALESLRGMCFLEESVCTDYRRLLPEKCFGYLPDVTETELPGQPGPIAMEIRRRAAGRKIVFMGGSIGWQKNVARWYELIAMADPAVWYFVQIGEVHRETFNVEERVAYEAALSAPPENFYLKAEYLPDEREFNEIIAQSDVIFAVYRDFSKSSNMPGKAAHFRKPLLVSDRYLMGTRVREYGIGLAVPEDDSRKMLEALNALAQSPVAEACFLRYRQAFSMDGLRTHLAGFLDACLGDHFEGGA